MPEEPSGSERTALVFNLGGGTCDASLIVMDAGVLEVRAQEGYTERELSSHCSLITMPFA